MTAILLIVLWNVEVAGFIMRKKYRGIERC